MPYTNLYWKVYDLAGRLKAACKGPYEAAAVVVVVGDGATIRVNGAALWHEGHELHPASDSFDFVAATMFSRANHPLDIPLPVGRPQKDH